MTIGAKTGALCVFSPTEVAESHLTKLRCIPEPLPIHPALCLAPTSCAGPKWMECLMGKQQNDSTWIWFTDVRHFWLCAVSIIALMSKQFITNLLGPFPEAFTELLCGCEIQHNECKGVQAGWKVTRTSARKQLWIRLCFQSVNSRGWHPSRSLSYGASMNSPNAHFVTPTRFNHAPLVAFSNLLSASSRW